MSVSVPLVFADETVDGNIVAQTDKQIYETGEVLFFSGHVNEKKMPILALRIFDPSGAILLANNLKVNQDATFSKEIPLDSPFYDQSGIYTMRVEYGKLEKEISFEIKDQEIIEQEKNIDNKNDVAVIISLNSDKPIYNDSDNITINGSVSIINEPSVLIGIFDPNGTPTGFYFGEINPTNEFSITFLAKEDVNFKLTGTYYAVSHYGDSKETVYFDFIKSDEEFEDTNEQVVQSEIAENNEIEENKEKKEIKEETPSIEKNNLTVEDIELGIMLNQNTLNCNKSEFVDIISYYDGMGPSLIRLCEYEESISYFNNELINDPGNVEVLTNKGSVLAMLGYAEEAIIHYDSALEIDASFIPALNNKGNALAELGKYGEASSIFTTGIKIDPENTILKDNLQKSNSKIINVVDNHNANNNEQLDDVFTPQINDTLTNIHETITENENIKSPSLLEQIGNVLSSIGSIFNFFS